MTLLSLLPLSHHPLPPHLAFPRSLFMMKMMKIAQFFLLEICPLKDVTDLRMHFLKNSSSSVFSG